MNDKTVAATKPAFPEKQNKTLFCFGYGYTAHALSEALKPHGWNIIGTTTDPEKCRHMKESGVQACLFDSEHPLADPLDILKHVTHVLVSIQPGSHGDMVTDMHGDDLARLPNLEWIGYLSSTAVYGNRDGKWVDEETLPAPTNQRGTLRYIAEEDWRELLEDYTLPVHFFRLAGIYGPGRSALDSVRAGNSRRIDKPGHAFSRIHIDDIVQTLVASINKPDPGAIYNLADDQPAQSHEVIAYACTLLGLDVPPLIPFEQVDLAPIVRSFYTDNKRIKNNKIKNELGIELLYPDYQTGLNACYETEREAAELIQDAESE